MLPAVAMNTSVYHKPHARGPQHPFAHKAKGTGHTPHHKGQGHDVAGYHIVKPQTAHKGGGHKGGLTGYVGGEHVADRQIKAHAHEREQHKGCKVYAQQVGYGLDKVFHRDLF